MSAQTEPAPAPAPAPKKMMMSSDDSYPKAELFVGYQWLNPGGDIPTTSVPPVAFKLPSITQGFGTNLTYNFTKVTMEATGTVTPASMQRRSVLS
jgi:hypothetical protein